MKKVNKEPKITDAYGREYPLENVFASVPSGWRNLVDLLIKDLFVLNWNGKLFQIKEKFGGLRFYTGSVTDAQMQRIVNAENESFKTCQDCGNTASARHKGTWIITLCEICDKSGIKSGKRILKK